ncbi:MAG: DNA polymerase ligase N-terminal domain-containing protein [Planctomycetales bacterium]
MPRFVVLAHDHPFLHWDLLLERGEALRAWRLLAEPLSAGSIAAQPLPDHRPMYLDYEGPLSGDRGSVARWDAGTFETRGESECRLELDFAGARLRGTFRLECGTAEEWRFHSPPD